MLEDVETGQRISTDVRPVAANDLRAIERGWRFDWHAEIVRTEAFKLIDPTKPDVILGLIALTRCETYVEVNLLESRPENVGRTKRFRGIAGSLLAFAAQLSFKIGGEGFVVLDAKSELIEHYEHTYGFERHGRSQRLILGTRAAARLIATHEGEAKP